MNNQNKKKRGLRVQWCNHTEEIKRGVITNATREGWFIMVWRNARWYALQQLRFARERDALRAAQTLTAAGLDNVCAFQRADPMQVMQLACEFLQW